MNRILEFIDRQRARLPAGTLTAVAILLVVGLAVHAAVGGGPTGSIGGGPEFRQGGAGAKHIVRVDNRKDTEYAGRGSAQYNAIPAPTVAPVNIAIAQSSCTDCTSFAVALQISTYQRGASFVAPQNAAAAVNVGCLRCLTVAVAIQYLIPVDDVRLVPHDVRALARDFDRELRDVAGDPSLTVGDRVARLQDIINRYHQFAAYVEQASATETAANGRAGDFDEPLPDETDDPLAEPSPAATDGPSPTASSTATTSASPTASWTTAEPTSLAPTLTPTPDPTPNPTPASTATAGPTDVPTEAPPPPPPSPSPSESGAAATASPWRRDGEWKNYGRLVLTSQQRSHTCPSASRSWLLCTASCCLSARRSRC